MSTSKLQVCIITGFLGAGKTTVLQRILPSVEDVEQVYIVVNDLSKDNMDACAFQGREQGPSQSVAALSGGCVCCNLLPDLIHQLHSAQEQGYTYAFIECTGVADPVSIAATLAFLPELQTCVQLDAIVAVLNAAELVSCGSSGAVALPLSTMNVMVGEQLPGANVVLINNWERLPGLSAAVMQNWTRCIKAFLRPSNRHVRVFCTNAGNFAFGPLVHRQGLFTKDEVAPFFLRAYAASGGSVGAWRDASEEAGEVAKLGLAHFTLELPGHHTSSIQKLQQALECSPGRQLLRQVWRSKGYFFAYDDGDDAQHQDTKVVQAATAQVSAGVKPEARSQCSGAVQFRWQTVQRVVDYGEVVPPYVTLLHSVSAAQLSCRIVFIGNFDVAEKMQQAEHFFESIAYVQ